MVAGRVSLGVERDLRNGLYEHLQQLELGFFDRQQTGQLMSRATVDLQAVRFFLGYGLVFILQSILTIVLAGAAMIALNPELGLAVVDRTTVILDPSGGWFLPGVGTPPARNRTLSPTLNHSATRALRVNFVSIRNTNGPTSGEKSARLHWRARLDSNQRPPA